MKILNLYAGIGGNRALWGDDHEIVAVENVPAIAEVYRQLWPNDTVIEADAHQYLLEHYQEFDFIWSSPPCPTHSKLQIPQTTVFNNPRYPDMTLYQEIILLKHFCRVPWVVENVIGYYTPLIPPTRELARHYFWTNFHLSKYYRDLTFSDIKENSKLMEEAYGITLPEGTINRRKLMRNAVVPRLGLHVFNCKDNLKQEILL